jgi:hypothetical protein
MKKNKKFLYNLIRYNNEVSLKYNLRKFFIETKNPKNNKELQLYIMYSNILINMIFLKCRYNNKTEKIVKKFIKDYKKIYTFMINQNF